MFKSIWEYVRETVSSMFTFVWGGCINNDIIDADLQDNVPDPSVAGDIIEPPSAIES